MDKEIEQKAAQQQESGNYLQAYIMHEIKTPLICVSSIMRSMLGKKEVDLDKVAMCEAALSELTTYLEDSIRLCDHSYNFKNIEIEAVDLSVFREYLYKFFGPLAWEKRLALDIQVHNDAFTYLYISRIAMIHILANLVTNAVKYTEPDGRIELLFDVKELEECRAQVNVTVKDNGRGMQDTDPEKAGNGMGLSVVKLMVEEVMRGMLQIDSRKNQGTSVQICFEADGSDERYEKKKEKKKKEKTDGKIAKNEYRGKKVLIAEDDELFMEWIVEALARYGIDADKTYDGDEVIDLFRDSAPEEYHAVLMDLGLPEKNGREAAYAIRQMERSDAATIPILAFTGMPVGDEQVFLAQCGMQAVVPKTFDEEELIRILSKLWG